jgi:hypothetical protein
LAVLQQPTASGIGLILILSFLLALAAYGVARLFGWIIAALFE